MKGVTGRAYSAVVLMWLEQWQNPVHVCSLLLLAVFLGCYFLKFLSFGVLFEQITFQEPASPERGNGKKKGMNEQWIGRLDAFPAVPSKGIWLHQLKDVLLRTLKWMQINGSGTNAVCNLFAHCPRHVHLMFSVFYKQATVSIVTKGQNCFTFQEGIINHTGLSCEDVTVPIHNLREFVTFKPKQTNKSFIMITNCCLKLFEWRRNLTKTILFLHSSPFSKTVGTASSIGHLGSHLKRCDYQKFTKLCLCPVHTQECDSVRCY